MLRCTSSTLIALALVAGAIGIGAFLAPSVARAETHKIALPKVKGPSKAGYQRLETGLRESLRAADLVILEPKALASAAKTTKKPLTSPTTARAAGAQYLLIVTVRRVSGANVAEGKLIDTKDGSLLSAANERWNVKNEAERAGSKLGHALLDKAGVGPGTATERDEATASNDDVSAGDGGGAVPRAPVSSEGESSSGGEASSSGGEASGGDGEARAPGVEPKDEAAPPVAAVVPTSVEPTETHDSGEDGLFQLSVGGGSRFLNNYLVVVGGAATKVNYKSAPLVLATAGLRIGHPYSGFGVDGSFDLLPTKYALDTRPVVEPASAKARFIGIEGSGWYSFRLVQFGETGKGAFSLAPFVGASYDRFTVDRQVRAGTQEPVTLLVSSVSLDLQGGLRVGLRISESFAIDLDGRYLRVVSFDEAPAKTGDPKGGNGFAVGLSTRVWFTQFFGVTVRGRFRHVAIATKGAGNRSTFDGDPELVDATIRADDVQAHLALMLAF